MGKHKRKPKPRRTRSKSTPKLEFTTFSIPEADHPAFKAAALAAAKASVTEFPKRLDDLRRELRSSSPLDVMSAFAFYGLQTAVSREGASTNSLLREIQQHHGELLQAIILQIPHSEWGKNPSNPDVTSKVLELVPKISETFLHRRLLAMDQIVDAQEKEIYSLQEKMRLNTQIVRNWGYYGDVVRISSQLYSSLDGKFSVHFGFSATDLIRTLAATVKEYERRLNEHWNVLRKIVRGSNYRQIIRLYYKYVPELTGSPEDMIAIVPPGTAKEGVIGFVMGHYDLHLTGRATFTASDLSEDAGLPSETINRVLKAISRQPGDLVDANPEHLFLANPVWGAPAIALPDGSFFLPMPQVGFSHIHTLMHRLAEEASAKDDLEKARSRYLEEELKATLELGLPQAKIVAGAKWEVEGKRFETDLLAIIDKTVVIAEAKSHRLTPEGLRGAPARVKRHIQDLVLEPSIQSARLEALIASAKDGEPTALQTVKALGIDPDQVDRVIRLSITLDDLSVLSSAEGDLKKVGWVPSDHKLAPTIHLADLKCIVDIVENPICIVHYLSERYFLQKSFELLGDELDFLGLYLDTGLNLGAIEAQTDNFSPSGMSSKIDRYYTSRDAGINLPKPKPALQPLFRKIVERLTERQPEGWTTIGIHLLGSADAEEQRRLENNLNKVRGWVRKNYRDPKHINSIQIRPPQARKAVVVFYLFPPQLRSQRRGIMEQLANEALADSGRQECVVFARCTEDWAMPYETICLTR